MQSEMKFTYIRDVTPLMKNINVQFIVLDVGTPRRTKDGNDVRTVRVADQSGSINVAVWNEPGACLKGGDICRLINGFVSVHKNALSVNCGRMGELMKIGEFCMLFSETPFMSSPNPDYAKYCNDQRHSTGGDGHNGSQNGGNAPGRSSQLAKPSGR